MKKLVFVLFALLIFTAGTAVASDYYWSGGDPNNNLISDPDNYWDGDYAGIPPGLGDILYFDYEWSSLMEMDETVDTEVAEVYLGKATEDVVFEMNVTGGSLQVSNKFVMSKDNKSGMEATLNMSGGTISTGGWFTIGSSQKGTVNITGGLIDVGSKLAMGMYGDGSGVLNLDGGTVIAGEIDIVGQSSTEPTVVNISDGTLILDGNQVTQVGDYVTSGKIVSTKQDFGIAAEYDEENNETVVTASLELTVANNPIPADNSAGVDYDRDMLDWTAGTEADKHDVYFGYNEADVEAADTSSDLYLGRIDPNEIAVDYIMGIPHYWRVDEVSADGTEIWTGDVWSFTPQNQFMIDDFEDYTGDEGSRVFEVWNDGVGYSTPDIVPGNGTGSQVGYAESPYVEQSGSGNGQMMPVYYNNDEAPYYSLITRTFETVQDFTREEIQAIGFNFKGTEDNDVEPIYLIVEDDMGNQAKLSYAGDAEDIAFGPIANWDSGFRFNADLADASSQGADLTQVKKVHIQIGEETASAPAGSGMVLIDNVSIFAPRCIWDSTGDGTPDSFLQTADFNHDCTVDEADMLYMAGQWLDSDQTLTAEEPDQAHKLVHYDFNGITDPNTIFDISGNGYDAYPTTGDTAVVQSSGGYNGSGYADFDGNFHFLAPGEAFSSLTDQVTISMWLKIPDTGAYQDVMRIYRIQWRDESARINLTPEKSIRFFSGSGDKELDGVNEYYPSDADQRWVHYAFVKDAGASRATIYMDGLPVETNYNADIEIIGSEIVNASLGGVREATGWGRMEGDMDEVQVYDYALAPAEILYLADVPSMTIPLADNSADVDDSGEINLSDYALMAGEWLKTELWPEPLY
ncbi:hypothetical protein L21SP3_00068 [Sedimentisphaera cyanobacteriorum]|uniref:LamG-like jellyroll fold domain-containing protein n=1 Tax=Sedimentisphaera cyanobacteriorum TaxID=1940790 RepID=A0A1Q2HLK0_9BACT|nr:LamG-like jellyroll fold domain-containing protein [Sedimentisphaera cyanobacteriorum]AQQ08292.1 hypothetical protein L21SP3_00068 [Sedimentisphaera cyanobacteriorum]